MSGIIAAIIAWAGGQAATRVWNRYVIRDQTQENQERIISDLELLRLRLQALDNHLTPNTDPPNISLTESRFDQLQNAMENRLDETYIPNRLDRFNVTQPTDQPIIQSTLQSVELHTFQNQVSNNSITIAMNSDIRQLEDHGQR